MSNFIFNLIQFFALSAAWACLSGLVSVAVGVGAGSAMLASGMALDEAVVPSVLAGQAMFWLLTFVINTTIVFHLVMGRRGSM